MKRLDDREWLEKIGHIYKLDGFLLYGDKQFKLITFPGAMESYAVGKQLQSLPLEIIHCEELDDMKTIIKQMDVVEVQLFENGQKKAIVRKSQRNLVDRIRWAVFKRDEYLCRYCGTDVGPMSVDHVKLWEHMGPDDETNLVTACEPCNRTRGRKLYKDWVQDPYYLERIVNVEDKFVQANDALVGVYETFPNRVSVRKRK